MLLQPAHRATNAIAFVSGEDDNRIVSFADFL